MITVIIDDLDISAYIQQTVDITEKMRKVYGKAQDTALDGTTIPNLVAIKYDPSFSTKPIPQSIAETLASYMEKETVTLQYTSFKYAGGQVRTITALPQSITLNYATDDYNGERIYNNMALAFEEQ